MKRSSRALSWAQTCYFWRVHLNRKSDLCCASVIFFEVLGINLPKDKSKNQNDCNPHCVSFHTHTNPSNDSYRIKFFLWTIIINNICLFFLVIIFLPSIFSIRKDKLPRYIEKQGKEATEIFLNFLCFNLLNEEIYSRKDLDFLVRNIK